MREVAQRVLLDQVGDNLGPERVDVRPHRSVMDQVRGTLVEHPGRFAALVAQDLAAARIGRFEVDPGDRHRGRVGVAGVVGVIHHADRIAGRDIVQLVARKPAAVGVSGAVSESPDPLPGWRRLGCGGDGVEHGRFSGQGRDPTIDRDRLEGRHREVVVRIDETGNQGTPAQVNMSRVAADSASHRVAVADRDDLAVAHRDSGHDPIESVHRQHASTSEEQFHVRLLAARALFGLRLASPPLVRGGA